MQAIEYKPEYKPEYESEYESEYEYGDAEYEKAGNQRLPTKTPE
jgi:hypothetical protein